MYYNKNYCDPWDTYSFFNTMLNLNMPYLKLRRYWSGISLF